MNKLFEEFTGSYLKEQLETIPGIKVLLQKPEYLDKNKEIRMRPDIVITKNKNPVLILDTKYKRLDAGQVKHADIYQMYVYCSTLKVNRGLLIYGEGEGAEYRARVPEDGLDIETVVLNLGGSCREFREECERLSRYVAGYIKNVVYKEC
jgi:5-methylcytosine-specific restriction enzyme subunit McrC